METNFDYLLQKKEYKDFATQAVEAERGIAISPATCASSMQIVYRTSTTRDRLFSPQTDLNSFSQMIWRGIPREKSLDSLPGMSFRWRLTGEKTAFHWRG